MKKIIFFLAFNISMLTLNFTFAQSWQLMDTLPTGEDLNSVFFTSADTGYVVGGSGGIYKTTDGGHNWYLQYRSDISSLGTIYFTDSLTGYVGGWSEMLKTTNGGNKWIITDSFPYGNNSIFFIDKSTGYCVCASGIIRKTTNGGDNWFDLEDFTNIVVGFNSVFFVNIDTGFVVGTSENNNNGIIFRTTNAGKNWTYQDSIKSGGFTDIFFPNKKNGYIVSGYNPGNYFLITHDCGNSWIKLIDNNLAGGSVFFTNSDTGFMVGYGGFIAQTTNGGFSWKILKHITYNWLGAVYFPNKNTGYAVGGNGTILKYTNPTDVINKLIMDNGKWKIYPNPTFNNLNIEYNTTNKIFRNSTFLIYNLQGEQVYIQEINKTISEINLNNLNKGVYIIKIQNSTDLTISKIIKL